MALKDGMGTQNTQYSRHGRASHRPPRKPGPCRREANFQQKSTTADAAIGMLAEEAGKTGWIEHFSKVRYVPKDFPTNRNHVSHAACRYEGDVTGL